MSHTVQALNVTCFCRTTLWDHDLSNNQLYNQKCSIQIIGGSTNVNRAFVEAKNILQLSTICVGYARAFIVFKLLVEHVVKHWDADAKQLWTEDGGTVYSLKIIPEKFQFSGQTPQIPPIDAVEEQLALLKDEKSFIEKSWHDKAHMPNLCRIELIYNTHAMHQCRLVWLTPQTSSRAKASVSMKNMLSRLQFIILAYSNSKALQYAYLEWVRSKRGVNQDIEDGTEFRCHCTQKIQTLYEIYNSVNDIRLGHIGSCCIEKVSQVKHVKVHCPQGDNIELQKSLAAAMRIKCSVEGCNVKIDKTSSRCNLHGEKRQCWHCGIDVWFGRSQRAPERCGCPEHAYRQKCMNPKCRQFVYGTDVESTRLGCDDHWQLVSCTVKHCQYTRYAAKDERNPKFRCEKHMHTDVCAGCNVVSRVDHRNVPYKWCPDCNKKRPRIVSSKDNALRL